MVVYDSHMLVFLDETGAANISMTSLSRQQWMVYFTTIIIHKHLLPHLMPYNGVNHHSVVVLDNCSVHHVAGVASMLEEVQSYIFSQLTYSPDLNPIEETLFFKSKRPK